MIKTLIILTLTVVLGFISAIAFAESDELSDEQTRSALQQIQAHRSFIASARPDDRKEIAAVLSQDNISALADGRKQYTSPHGQCRQIRSSSFFECTIDYTYQLPNDRQITHPVTHIIFKAFKGMLGEVAVIEVLNFFRSGN